MEAQWRYEKLRWHVQTAMYLYDYENIDIRPESVGIPLKSGGYKV